MFPPGKGTAATELQCDKVFDPLCLIPTSPALLCVIPAASIRPPAWAQNHQLCYALTLESALARRSAVRPRGDLGFLVMLDSARQDRTAGDGVGHVRVQNPRNRTGEVNHDIKLSSNSYSLFLCFSLVLTNPPTSPSRPRRQ